MLQTIMMDDQNQNHQSTSVDMSADAPETTDESTADAATTDSVEGENATA